MKALIAVDVQNDFLPGGALAVARGDEVIEPILQLAGTVDLVIATADSHPADHCSFVEQGGEWPSHCVRGTTGQQLDRRIYDALDALFPKGSNREREAYSGFESGGLDEFLLESEVTDVIVAGLATDYCVLATVLDSIDRGYVTTVHLPACRGVAPGTTLKAIEDMERAGARVVR